MTLQQLLNQWFEIAADDIAVAKGCINKHYPPKYSISCYHSQQAVNQSQQIFDFCLTKVPQIKEYFNKNSISKSGSYHLT